MNSAGLARLHWSLFSSATWTPVSKPRFRLAPTHLSVKVRRPSVWQSVYVPLPQALGLDDARWLNEMLENRLKLEPLVLNKESGELSNGINKISKENPMNKDVFEGKWKQIRGEAKAWWGKLTDDDLDRAAGKFDVLSGIIQEKYGYTREAAADEIDKRVTEYEANLKKNTTPTP
jgi:uncharacterized protein YjbJ (UPF0337 family)